MSDYNNSALAAELITSPEVSAAVDWWTEQLLEPPHHDAGDPGINLAANLGTSQLWRPLDKREIERFKMALRTAITVLCLPSWKKENPNSGSALRTIATDYGPDHVLQTALYSAMINDTTIRLPIKTVMWISPGLVEVSRGYGSERQAIYGAPKGGDA